ncbi:uncharacterized protein PRCAT00003208001 [Priceomyces carsonii]|uniref:uncharacterized protein n=1 Tax=Priceomyces carsonii TaxID=28549 RepID=UPI002ED9854D|nr:unnamed protein product [Priceomyces carsonii]
MFSRFRLVKLHHFRGNLNFSFIRYYCTMLVRRLGHLKSVPKIYCNNTESITNVNKIATSDLLVKLGYIQHPSSGFVNWLPLGIKSLDKLKNIVRRRMEESGFEEISLTSLSSSALWKKSERWNNTELFKLADSSNHEYCLAATAEEEVTQLVINSLTSYKSLPLLYYQISKKYRDEKRPRGGLLRGKEFIMKDGYSFDLNETDALKTYSKVVNAYVNIFNDLKVPFIKAEADTGDMGGSLSHEWHYLHESGEDTVFTCDSCGHVSNIEKTISFPEEVRDAKEVSVKYLMTKDKSTLVCAYYPSDRALQATNIKIEIPDIDLANENEEEILKEFSDEDSLISKKIVRIMDARLTSRSNFPDFPIKFINRSLITTLTDVPIVSAIEGELCGNCEEGSLELSKAIEVGHTFFLGDKYTKSLGCSIETPNDKGGVERKLLQMGCYGIGLSRIIAAIAEMNKDVIGLRWPSALSPWDVTVIEAPSIEDTLESFYDLLSKENIDFVVDRRAKLGIGKKIKQSNLMGIPISIIVGKKFPMVEIEVRGKRYNKELEWKKLHDDRSRDFDWEVTYNLNGDDIKHLVHINGLAVVLKCLLKDM